jgi:hypothetical protein
LDAEVAALAEGGKVPPSQVVLDAVEVVDGKDAPLSLSSCVDRVECHMLERLKHPAVWSLVVA